MRKEDCVFCDFKDKEVIIHEDELSYSIISKQPVNKYHVLVIPKEHYEDFIELPDNLVTNIFLAAKKLSAAVRETCEPDAIHHISDDDISKAGFNGIRHYKLHIIPRFSNDDVRINWNREADPGIVTRSKLAKEVQIHLKRD